MRTRFTKTLLIQLAFLLVLGSIIFFIKLSSIPSGVYIDETLPAYSAYSILKTGRDEYGKVFPLVFRFYGSYNPPLFIYLTVVSEVVFGLTTFAVRFPSALAGMLSVFPIFFLLKEKQIAGQKHTAFISSLLFLFTPWIILHSRVGYEVSLGFLLFSIGTYFSFRGLTHPRFLKYAMLFLSLSTYAAYAERFIVPMFIVFFILFFKKTVIQKGHMKDLLITIGIGLVTQIPNLWLLTTPAFFPKQNLVGSGIVLSSAEKISHFLPYPLSFTLAFIREFLSQYVTYFSPQSLFFLPDPDLQRSIPYLSVFYSWMIVPFCIGVYVLFKNRDTIWARFIILLALITPIPAALTLDPFSTHRALPHLLPLFLIISLGIDRVLVLFHKRQKTLVFVCLSLFTISLLFLWRSYFILLPYTRAQYWGYGHEQLAIYIVNHPQDHFVIDQTRIKPVYSQLAFYMKTEPRDFQKTIDPFVLENYYKNTPFDGHFTFGNIDTRGIVWETDIYEEQVLVGDPLTISTKQAEEHSLTKVFEFTDHLNTSVFVGYKTNPTKKCRISNYASEKCSIYKN